MLEIQGLKAQVAGIEVLHGIDLSVKAGEVHAIMGPNGSGKSTLGKVLAGLEDYEVTGGSVRYLGRDLLELSVEERAQQGVFLGFQYPVEIPGVGNDYFLKTALNAQRKARGEEELGAADFLRALKAAMKTIELDDRFRKRFVNVGFSGGEKKRNEILQLLMLQPRLAVLDETDSGLDIDALRVVAQGVNALRSPERGFVLVTHYERLLNYIQPDYVHVLVGGRIVRSGGPELAGELESSGYAEYGPRLVGAWRPATNTVLELSWNWTARPFDSRSQTDILGTPLTGTRLTNHDLRTQLEWRQTWDAGRRFQTSARLLHLRRTENGEGFSDSDRLGAVAGMTLRLGRWQLRGTGRWSTYDFAFQIVSPFQPVPRTREEIGAEARIECRLGEPVRLYAEYAYEEQRSNVPSDNFRAQTGLLGIEYDF